MSNGAEMLDWVYFQNSFFETTRSRRSEFWSIPVVLSLSSLSALSLVSAKSRPFSTTTKKNYKKKHAISRFRLSVDQSIPAAAMASAIEHMIEAAAIGVRDSAEFLEDAKIIFRESSALRVAGFSDTAANELRLVDVVGNPVSTLKISEFLHGLVSGDEAILRQNGFTDAMISSLKREAAELRPTGGIVGEINVAKNSLPESLRAAVDVSEDTFRSVARTDAVVSKGANAVERAIDAAKRVGNATVTTVKGIGAVVVYGAVGLTVYKFLENFAREHSGCYMIDKRNGNATKVTIEENPSVDGGVSIRGIGFTLKPEARANYDRTRSPCYGVCSTESFDMGLLADSFEFKCTEMNVFDAAALIANNVTDVVVDGLNATIGFAGYLKYIIPACAIAALTIALVKYRNIGSRLEENDENRKTKRRAER